MIAMNSVYLCTCQSLSSGRGGWAYLAGFQGIDVRKIKAS